MDIEQPPAPAPALVTAPAQPVRQPRAGGLVRNTLNLVVGQVLTTGLTIVLTAAIGRTLGPHEFGILYLVTAVTTFAYVFVDWGHGPYVIREVARHPERAGELMGSVMAVRAAMAVLLTLPSVIISSLLGYETRTIVLVAAMMAALMPMYLGLTYGWAFRGAERMQYDALINVCLKLSALVFGVVVLSLGGRVPALLLSTGLAGSVTLVVASLLYHRLHFPKLQVRLSTARELMIGGAPMVSMTIAVAIQPYIDVNLLSRLAAPGVVGWYGAAMTFCNTLIAPAAVLTSAAYPRLAVVAGDRAGFAKILQEGFRPLLLVAVLGAVGTYLFADVAVGIVYSLEQFGPSVSILRAFAPAMMLIFIDMMLTTSIVAAGGAARVAFVKGMVVVLISGLEIWLIPFCQARFGNGGLGIMVALMIGELIMIGTDIYLLRGMLTRGLATDTVRALAAGAATFVLMQVIRPIPPVAGIPLCVVLFAVASFAVGLITMTDVTRLTEILRRMGSRRSLSSSLGK